MVFGESSSDVLADVIPSIIDTHIHQWDPLTTPREASSVARVYRILPAVGDRLFRLRNQADREFALTPRNLLRPYRPRDYLADVVAVEGATGVPIGSAVHIEAGWHSAEELGPAGETHWVDELPFGEGRSPSLGAIVGHADPRDPHVADLLDAHLRAASRSPFRGIRSMAARHPDPRVRDWTDEDHALTSAAFLRGFAAVAERHLSFEAWVYSHQMADVVRLAREYPEVTIVLDHYATPVGVFGPMGSRTGHTAAARADIYARWRDGIAEVASCPNVVAKHSGLAFPFLGYGHQASGNIGSQATLTDMMGPLIDHTTDVFGPDRVMFGSNYPIDKPNASVAMIVGTLLDVLTPRGPNLLRKVFRDNAIRVYRLDA
ncbi:amidohydrolase family protein [Williamsia sp.]|uniref:amidohydrolase family protein n=1 Tax=Williamsia sp. TaxID=1872085 RepID=UPI001A1C6EC8|nr:amidohydrolase family protein [Williamsia sp.]MBJ7291179.1 amidohydrolase family protein [Williamsia sp.]